MDASNCLRNIRMDRSNFTNHIQCIYAIRNTETNTRYIGQTSQLYNRIRQHEYCLDRNIHDNYKLQEAWNVYGADKFVVDIIEECLPEVFNERETYWLHHFQPNIYNLGSTNMPGTVSEEIKQKIRDHALRGDDNPARRPEVRQLISAKHKGKVIPQEMRERISQKLKGRKVNFSESHIQALRDSSPNKRNVIQLTLDGDLVRVWSCMSDAARYFGSTNIVPNIVACCQGKQKSCKGYKWMYPEDYENYLKGGLDG